MMEEEKEEKKKEEARDVQDRADRTIESFCTHLLYLSTYLRIYVSQDTKCVPVDLVFNKNILPPTIISPSCGYDIQARSSCLVLTTQQRLIISLLNKFSSFGS